VINSPVGRAAFVTPNRYYLARDSFSRPDSAVSMGTAEQGGAWTADYGTWGISSGRAYPASPQDFMVATVNVGTPDVAVSAIIRGQFVGSNFAIPHLCVRVVDFQNLLFVLQGSGMIRIQKIVAGDFTSMVNVASAGLDNVDRLMEVSTRGRRIIAAIDGRVMLSYDLTDAEYALFGTPTKVGLRFTTGGTPTVAPTWDDFKAWRA
jgi:hypothetical protein